MVCQQTLTSVTASPFATPEPSRSTRRTSSRVTQAVEIPDSDGIEEVVTVSSNTQSKFAGVYVPTMKPRASRTRAIQQSDSSRASSIADSNDTVNYETPETSAVNTPPAETSSSRPKVGATARALELRTSTFALGSRSSSRKRKLKEEFTPSARTGVDEFFDIGDHDAELAAKLQAEEYGGADDSDDQPIAKRRRVPDTSSVLDESDEDFEDDMPLAKRKFATGAKGRGSLVASSSRGRGRPSAVASSSRAVPAPRVPSADSSALSSVGLSLEESEFDESDSDAMSVTDDDGSIDDVNAQQDVPVAAASVSRPRRRRRRRGEDWDPKKSRATKERAKLEKAHPEIKTMWDDLKDVEIIKPVAGDQPEAITRKLKSFQLEGVDWMKKQEQSQWSGGLLGDEMGMGKTIQAVTLIMSDFPAKQPTLVVVPPVALMQWSAEIKAYTDGKLSVLIYHISANPKCKNMTVKDLKKYNVIMVSYSSLESMFRKESKGWQRNDGIVKEDSVLHAIKYHRLILDEAHSIKSRTTGVAKACFALRADYKWCLSGTPVQNRIGEFFSLLRFLDVVPFACYFCKQCACKELHWSQNEKKMCNKCKHSGFNHVSVFNQEILNPITQGEDTQLRKAGLAKLRLITDRIMLRRMKRDHTSSMELPPKDVIIHNEFFGEIERDFSQSIMSNSARKFDTYVSQGVMLNNYANIFGLIMQMRQVANHPDLILRKNAEGGQNVLVCRLCDEPAEEAIRSRCRHEFCRQCAKNYIRAFDGKDTDAECPVCHIGLQIDWDQPEIEQDEETVKKNSIINRIKMEDWTSSTKIEMLVYDLYKLRSQKQTHKSIVFSQFTSMLQLVQWRLQKSGFSTVLLDGSMSPSQRQKSIEHFMNNVDVEVFLVSLKAGGVALNLTEASRVFIIDP